ncbi:MAG: family 10 glycosylhydrolase, partial [Bacteroidota bacterium]
PIFCLLFPYFLHSKSAFKLAFSSSILITDTFPKREFRGVWVATVNNIDWPSTKGLSSQQQKQEFTALVKYCKKIGINAMIVQVRASADAFFESKYEPWSHWLTGKQGQLPNPYYDPLAFMVEVCHNHNIEFHAWINPFRSVQSSRIKIADQHIFKQKPAWHFKYHDMQILNPGIPEVRNYISEIVRDIVSRYHIDAIHFDDYFYPYPVKNERIDDIEAYKAFNPSKLSLADWRRENINQFIAEVAAIIKTTNPEVKFGISPPGIWRNAYKDPEGSDTKGLSSFDDIYADSRSWAQKALIDYIIPQVYWNISHNVADYKKLINWWEKNSFNTQLYIGHAAYKMDESQLNAWKDGREIDRQIASNRKLKRISGSAFFSVSSLIKNKKSFTDSLQTKYYRHPALLPKMPQKDALAPSAPLHLKKIKTDTGWLLSWKDSPLAHDGDTAKGFLLYRFPDTCQFDLENTRYLIDFLPASKKSFHDKVTENSNYNYLLTAYDHLHNESIPAFQFFNDTVSIKVGSVIVALQTAQIEANASVNLQNGTNRIILKNLPHSLIKGSLNFKTVPSASINLTRIFPTPTNDNLQDSASVYLNNKLGGIDRQLTVLSDSLYVFQQAEELLLKNQQLAKDKTTVIEIRDLTDYFTQSLLNQKKKIRDLTEAKKVLEEKKKRIKRQLAELNSMETDSTKDTSLSALLEINSAFKQVIEIAISYQVKDVDWRPEYNLFYNKSSNELQIEYKAEVMQKSGQHWKDIPLSVSSEIPHHNEKKESFRVPAIFKIAPKNVSIFSSDQKQQIFLGNDNPEFQSELKLNIDSATYPDICLNIHQATSFEWFPGKMNVFINNQLQQTNYFKPKVLKDTLNLVLGKDVDIEVKKEMLNTKSKNYLLFKKHRAHYQLIIRNHKNKNINLYLSATEVPKLKNKKSTKFFDKAMNAFNFRNQTFEWIIDVPAGETLKMVYGFEYNEPLFSKS